MSDHLHLRALVGVSALLLVATAVSAQYISFQPSYSEPAVPEFTVDIHLDAMGENVQGLDITFSYDASIIQLDGVAAGYWFTGSALDHYFWEDPATTPGSAHFSAALLGAGSSQNGTVATLSFTALAAGVSPLDFNVAACTVRDADNHDLPALYSTGDFVRIDAAIPTEPLSFSRVKVLWR